MKMNLYLRLRNTCRGMLLGDVLMELILTIPLLNLLRPCLGRKFLNLVNFRGLLTFVLVQAIFRLALYLCRRVKGHSMMCLKRLKEMIRSMWLLHVCRIRLNV